jgi:opacity protein-like surface antigen
MLFGATLALALCAAPLFETRAADREPVTGGLVATPAAGVPPAPPPAMPEQPADPPALEIAPPAPAVAAETAPHPGKRVDDTSWGLLLRGGYFGLPDVIADQYFNQHPKIEGTIYGGELRYHGEGGGRGGASIGFAVDSGSAKADGIWQPRETDPPKATSGEISMLAITVTGYWSLFPSWYVHPYFGIGIGAAHLKGSYQKDDDLTDVDIWFVALHVPVGMAIELGPRFQLSAEARFIDGISAGGALQVRF